DPRAWASLGLRLEVLIAVEAPVALGETEAHRTLRAKLAHAQRLRVVERPPQPFAALEVDEEPVGIVHLGAEVVEPARRVLAAEEHARQRCDAELLDGLAQEELAFDLDDRLVTGRHDEVVCTRDPWAVEERIERHLLRVPLGFHEPELAEIGKLLTPGLRRVDGETPGGKTEDLILAEGAEV